MSEDKRQDDDLELAADSGEEELMSDFRELFPEEEEPPEGEVNESLEELDAFLDDFEQGLEQEDAQPGERDDATATLELKEDELDLAVGETEGTSAGEPGLAPEELPESEALPASEELAFTAQRDTAQAMDEPLSGAVAAGLAGAAAAGAAGGAAPATAPAKGTLMLMSAILTVAVLLSAAALWLGMGVNERLDGIETRLTQLQQRAGASSAASGAQMQSEIQQLAARVSELAVIIEGPISHLRQSNEESLAELSRRIEQLEQQRLPPTAKQAEKASPAREVPAAASVKGGWVINLLSLSNEKDATQEMERLRKAGVRVEVQQAVSDGKTWYRLRVPGFASYEGAKAYIDTVQRQAGVKNAWVAKE